MKFEDHVVSLELAEELKELGVKQDSIFYWIQQGEYIDDWSEAFLVTKKERNCHYNSTLEGDCAAPTVAELGEMLPEGYFSQKDRSSWGCANPDNTFGISNIYDCGTLYSEADARAKMVIYLIKAGLIKAGEVGK